MQGVGSLSFEVTKVTCVGAPVGTDPALLITRKLDSAGGLEEKWYLIRDEEARSDQGKLHVERLVWWRTVAWSQCQGDRDLPDVASSTLATIVSPFLDPRFSNELRTLVVTETASAVEALYANDAERPTVRDVVVFALGGTHDGVSASSDCELADDPVSVSLPLSSLGGDAVLDFQAFSLDTRDLLGVVSDDQGNYRLRVFLVSFLSGKLTATPAVAMDLTQPLDGSGRPWELHSVNFRGPYATVSWVQAKDDGGEDALVKVETIILDLQTRGEHSVGVRAVGRRGLSARSFPGFRFKGAVFTTVDTTGGTWVHRGWLMYAPSSVGSDSFSFAAHFRNGEMQGKRTEVRGPRSGSYFWPDVPRFTFRALDAVPAVFGKHSHGYDVFAPRAGEESIVRLRNRFEGADVALWRRGDGTVHGALVFRLLPSGDVEHVTGQELTNGADAGKSLAKGGSNSGWLRVAKDGPGVRPVIHGDVLFRLLSVQSPFIHGQVGVTGPRQSLSAVRLCS